MDATASIGTATAGLTVNPSPVCIPTSLTLTPGIHNVNTGPYTEGDQIIVTVTLNMPAPTGGQSVVIGGQVTGLSYQTSLTIPAGQTSNSFTITTSTSVASNINTTVTGTCNSVSASAPLTVNAEAITGVATSPSSINTGASDHITVTVSQPAGAAGLGVTLTWSTPGVTINGSSTGSYSYTMGAGETSFQVTARTNAMVITSNTTVTITATLSNGSTYSGSFTVNATATSFSSINTPSGSPGDTVTLTATLKDSTNSPVAYYTVTFVVLDGSHGGNGTTITATTNSSGVASGSYTIPTGASPGSLSFTVTFAGSNGYAGSTGTGSITVL